jgi:FG-GAP-like repeat
MALAVRAAARAAAGICALWGLLALSGCEGALGTSPPHAAPSNPTAEGRNSKVDLTWGAVTDATRYVILWGNDPDAATYDNEITGIEGTSYTHEGLENFTKYRYKIVAETSGGRGPESLAVTATPGTVPGSIEWTAVTAQNPGHTIYFPAAPRATHYRVYFASIESQLDSRRPNAPFVEAQAPPRVRRDILVTTALYYRVFAMNDSRIGAGGPIAVSPSRIVSQHHLGTEGIAGAAFGLVDDDDCLDLPTALGSVNSGTCSGSFAERELDEVGLEDLTADPRKVGDVRLADFNGDGFDEIFSNVAAPATNANSIALLHVNQGDGEFVTSPAVSALAMGGFGGTILAADFDNDGDLDLFAPNDQTRGDGARNWLLVNDGDGGFTDAAAAAGVETNPAGAAYVPRGGQAVDFDENGYVDLLFGSRLLLNNGDGTFSDGSVAANVPVLADEGLKLIDVDLDGDFDLIHHDGALTRLFRNAGGVFDGGEVLDAPQVPSEGRGLNACDINGDGFEDVIVARNGVDSGRGTPRTLLNVNGSLLFSATQRGTQANPGSLLAPNARLACGDEDANGMIDFISRWGPGGSYRLLRGASSLSRRIQLRIVGAEGTRNQQGRIVRVVPVAAPTRIMTRVVDSGSGLQSQNMYDLLVGAPWPGDYDVTVRFAGGDVTTTLQAGDAKIIFEDGTVEDIDPDEE